MGVGRVATDLTDFGLEEQANHADGGGGEDSSRRTYRNGRCPAISITTRKRCASSVSRMNAADGFCGVHGREHDPWTIHDDPEALVIVTGGLDCLSLDDLDESDVDFDLGLIRDALGAVDGGENGDE